MQLTCFRFAFEYIVCNTGTHVATPAVWDSAVSVVAAAAAAAEAAADLEAHAAYVFAVSVSVAAAADVAITVDFRPILSVYSKLKRAQQRHQ